MRKDTFALQLSLLPLIRALTLIIRIRMSLRLLILESPTWTLPSRTARRSSSITTLTTVTFHRFLWKKSNRATQQPAFGSLPLQRNRENVFSIPGEAGRRLAAGSSAAASTLIYSTARTSMSLSIRTPYTYTRSLMERRTMNMLTWVLLMTMRTMMNKLTPKALRTTAISSPLGAKNQLAGLASRI